MRRRKMHWWEARRKRVILISCCWKQTMLWLNVSIQSVRFHCPVQFMTNWFPRTFIQNSFPSSVIKYWAQWIDPQLSSNTNLLNYRCHNTLEGWVNSDSRGVEGRKWKLLFFLFLFCSFSFIFFSKHKKKEEKKNPAPFSFASEAWVWGMVIEPSLQERVEDE